MLTCSRLPSRTYALGFSSFGRECPGTATRAYNMGHPQASAWSLGWLCQTAADPVRPHAPIVD